MKVVTVDMLFRSDVEQPGLERTMLTECLPKPVAESTIRAFDGLITAHDIFISLGLEHEGPQPSSKPSKKEGELLQAMLQAQCEKGKQRLQRLLHGDNDEPHATARSLRAIAKWDEIWSSPAKADQPGDLWAMNEQGGSTWYSITKSAGKGVRRIVKGFPEAPTCSA